MSFESFNVPFLSQHNKFSEPPDVKVTIVDLFYDVMSTTSYDVYLKDCRRLFDLAERSLEAPELVSEIDDVLASVGAEDFDQFIHVLHMMMFIFSLDLEPDPETSIIPVTDAMRALLTHVSVKDALPLLPLSLVDVLTSHPVDMDRGLIVNYKRQLESLNRQWVIKKVAYHKIQDEIVKLASREELAYLSRSIRDTLFKLIYTPNYRQTRIKPESEQRNLSRAIKANEESVITYWPKLILFVQFVLIEAIIEDLLATSPDLEESLAPYRDLARSHENLRRLKAVKLIADHPLFDEVLALKDQMTYGLHIWRGDMDGNPFVTGPTIALSIAYGRKRSFEGLSADDAVIRYVPNNAEFEEIERILRLELDQLKVSGEPAWIAYIKSREAEEWPAVQLYSGLIYYRMVEMTEAAELYTRTQESTSLLTVGFKNEAEFLELTELLQQAEEAAGVRRGPWARCRRLVMLRGLSLGLPHARKGEAFHLALIEEYLSGHEGVSGCCDFETMSADEKKHCLRRFLEHSISDLGAVTGLSEESRDLLSHYQIVMAIQPDAYLVQSDSGSVTKDIELSILVLKSVAHMVGHQGSIAVLCEDKVSMELAVELMERADEDRALFDRVIMMCAGSDNQKKAGPFYSAYINMLFLKTAYRMGIRAFFGVGDSPLRSSTLDPQCELKTFQPGSRKHYFFGDQIFSYLSHRMATQIDHVRMGLSQTPEEVSCQELITQCLGESMYRAYSERIRDRVVLHEAIKSISEIVTTYFSRPSKKYKSDGFILDQIRAIDSGRAQLILNTFDPQLLGLLKGLEYFQEGLNAQGISQDACYRFFNDTPLGRSFLETLSYFAAHLDDDLELDSSEVDEWRSVTSEDVKTCYKALSGQDLTCQVDPALRLSRLVWRHVSYSPEKKHHQAVAMMMFGSNWMV